MNIIYKMTCSVNGKTYIGCTSRPLSVRFSEHKYKALTCRLNIKLYNAIRKYGINKFKIEKLETCNSRDEMLRREMELIVKYKTCEFGYNTSIGGESGAHGLTGEKHWSYGTKRTKEQRDHQSRIMKGRYSGNKNPFFGQVHSDESKRKISVSNKKRNYKPQTTKLWNVLMPDGSTVSVED